MKNKRLDLGIFIGLIILILFEVYVIYDNSTAVSALKHDFTQVEDLIKMRKVYDYENKKVRSVNVKESLEYKGKDTIFITVSSINNNEKAFLLWREKNGDLKKDELTNREGLTYKKDIPSNYKKGSLRLYIPGEEEVQYKLFDN